MGFLDRLFGRKKQVPKDNGIYFYVRCQNCDRVLHTRLDPKRELWPTENGFKVRKEMRDDRCFRQIILSATFDRSYQVLTSDVTGGLIIDRQTWQAEKELPRRPPAPPIESASDL
ncbi:MAG: hypothetical protein ACPGWR_20900 [Ardenticatenaceae bacterium]